MKRVLVVDNDEKLLEMIAEYLGLCQYQVTTACSGLEALQLFRSENFDVLLTDIVMPDISGLGLIELARREQPGLVVIAMTGYGEKVRNLAQERRPDYYLEKPFNLMDLSSAIEAAFPSA